MREYDIVIIGGGPAGLATAVVVRDNGVESILVLECDKELGGILNQYIHNGFGLHTFKEELTGPKYVVRFEEQVYERKIRYKLDTMVMDISHDKVVTAMNREGGLFEIQVRVVILVMGYRERFRGVLNIPGYRPAGIYCTGTVQCLVNMEGFIPGREVVILGSGDIGLIMARRMTLKGARVKAVAELMPYSGELKRNIVQCLDDYGIPLKLSHTAVDIRGKERLEGITPVAMDEKGEPIPGTEEDYTCDTLLLSVGLISENELSGGMGVKVNHATPGPVVNESLETNIEGVFVYGNVLHVHDLVDFVSEEATAAGKNAARYVKDGRCPGTGQEIESSAADGVRYTMSCITHPDRMEEIQVVCFRVGNVYKNCYIGVYFDDEQVMYRKRPVVASGEMEEIKLQKERLMLHPDPKKTTIKVEEAQTMEKREPTRIGCPMGCPLTVELEDGEIKTITGYTRKKGKTYTRKEVTNPTRIVTSTVRVEGGRADMISVKTREDVPKDKIFQCVKALEGVTAKAPIRIGNVVVADVASTGVNIVATKEVLQLCTPIGDRIGIWLRLNQQGCAGWSVVAIWWSPAYYSLMGGVPAEWGAARRRRRALNGEETGHQ